MIIKAPLTTEKIIRLIDLENKLVFVVDLKATKQEIKEEIERLFKVKVEGVNTLITSQGKKHAYVKFNEKNPAIDLATKLGIM